jgi:type IV pilus assembly protein PilB
LLIESGLKVDQYRDFTFYEGDGCIECNGTGFRGRTAIHELLDLSDHIREMIIERRPTSEIKRAAGDEGMTFLRDSALEKVFAGITTLKEINKVTFIE